MRNVRRFAAALTCAAGVATLVATVGASPGISISGGGIVNVTDTDGVEFQRAGEFAISGGIRPDGSPFGRIDFVFRRDFAGYWGAIPGVTHVFRLSGDIADVSVDGDHVILTGVLTETDTAKGDGVVFVEQNVPFEIIAQRGSDAFVMQFCLLPPFYMSVASGHLHVDSSGPVPAVAALRSRARAPGLSCPAPAP